VRVYFIALGICLLTFAKVSTLTCERAFVKDDKCQIVKHGFLWSEEKNIPVDQLKGARMIVGGRDIDSHTYQVVLVTNSGDIPFSPNSNFSDKKEQQEAASRIDNFARSRNKTSLDVSLDDRWWVAVGLISLTIGLYPYLFKKNLLNSK
jgi:hypothetical protein